ncbi:uncharacterized protein LOC132753563 [Ruditapes philippinarum]|uniref:uncharacterized protein LOC132753563 n=1 Tax=Ruditapes philippinarum TaxID=129788 RepID=UPI00295B3216|nr:uncharacterized protein LOC132753563 [Ruditapes philippinarum]
MEHILDTVQTVKTATTLNSIADKISEKLEETVSIHVTTNLFEFRDVFNDAGAQDLRSKRCSEGDQALKRSSSNESYGNLESIPESFELLKVSCQEEKEVMENVTNKQVSVIQSVDYTFPCYRPTKLGIQDGLQDGKRLHDTSFDQRLVHSLDERPNENFDDTYSLDKMLRGLSDSDLTFDHVLQLERAKSTFREIEARGRKVTGEDLNDFQTDIELFFTRCK